MVIIVYTSIEKDRRFLKLRPREVPLSLTARDRPWGLKPLTVLRPAILRHPYILHATAKWCDVIHTLLIEYGIG